MIVYRETDTQRNNMTKKCLLIDVDSTIPNLALMKISTWKKSLGYEVGFDISDPDEIYASCVFDKNRHKLDGLEFLHPNAYIDRGGVGYDLHKKLPDEVDLMMPDYSLYPGMDYDLGFTTRGCIRNCYFCVVPKKEGKFRRVQHPREFHDPTHKNVMLLDNNILADKEWFMEITDWFIENNLKVSFNQGLDVRLMDKEITDRLSKVKTFERLRIAFDTIGVKDAVVKGIDMMNKSGIDCRNRLICYVYVHDDSQFDNALERCMILKENKVLPYLQLNRNYQFGGMVKTLRRYTQPAIFFGTDWETYLESRKKIGKLY